MVTARPRAVLLTQAFAPETHAGANRATAMADVLAERFALTVVAPAPSHPTPEYHAGRPVAALDAARGYPVVRTGPFRPHSAGYLRRGMREMQMASRLALRGLRRVEAVVATSPSFFLGPAAYLAARLGGAAFVWDVRDLPWEYARQTLAAMTRRRRLRAVATVALTGTARFVGRHADVFWGSNPGIIGFGRRLRCPEAPTRLVPNGVALALYRELAAVAEVTPPPAPLRVTYAGALGYYQGLETLLAVAAEMPAVEFFFVGDGPERCFLEERAAAAGLGNVTFTGYVDRGTLFDIYAQSHVLFAQLRDLPVMAEATVPSKVYEYLATGRPVLYGGGGVTAELLAGSGAAVVVAPRADAIRQALRKLLADGELRADMGRAGRAFAARNVREELLREVVAELYRLVTAR